MKTVFKDHLYGSKTAFVYCPFDRSTIPSDIKSGMGCRRFGLPGEMFFDTTRASSQTEVTGINFWKSLVSSGGDCTR